AVPQFASDFVGKIFVHGGYAGVPHVATIFISEQEPALPEVFVVRIDAAADVTIGVRPGACLDVDALSDEAKRRPSLEGFDQSAFCFLVKNGPASQFTQSSKFQKQRAGFCRIRQRTTCLASTEIDVNIREPCG